jgi:hypothetical protein
MSYIPSIWIWLGIIACITLSALFAGLNLAIFSLSQLRLQIEADGGNKDAARVLDLRKNSNQVLATVIWGNVGTNVFLTLLSDSVLAGLGAFFFSAVVITLFGEIAPQAYFSRNALRMTARFLPFLIFWRAALFFLARPTAILLDWWLGAEGIAIIVTDLDGEPAFVLDSHHFLRDALFNQPDKIEGACWHRPVIVRDMQTQLGDVIGCLKVAQERPDDDVIDNDLILVWGSQRRIITGSDLLGRLLRGIAHVEAGNAAKPPMRRQRTEPPTPPLRRAQAALRHPL